MNEKNIGISQETLVSGTGGGNRIGSIDFIGDSANKRWPQYVAAFASTLGALASGMVLGWTSSAGDNGKNLQSKYEIDISEEEFAWISSISTLGSGAICIPIGILADVIGRKYSMLLMVVPFTLGWLLIIFANSVAMFCIGRFITGISGGAFCVTAPMYAAEIAEKEIRGALGSYFQLLLTVGILLSYVVGGYVNMRDLSIISGIVPLIFFVVFVFMPESPTYYLKKGKEECARRSLIKLRANHNVENELQSYKDALEEDNRNKGSFWTSMRSKATVKGIIIAYGLMFFQQLCGVNVVIFYTNSIFEKAGSTLKSLYATIIVGAMQVLAAAASTLIVDHVGRRILLLTSIIFLCLSSFVLGLYFYLVDIEIDVSSVGWLPLVSVCVFIIMFNIGFGPVPWTMVGEIFAPEVKGIVASSACLLNWILAFIVTKFFSDLSNAIGIGETFWFFAGICFIGVFFVLLLVPETKGKSLEQIQRELNGS